MVYGKWLDGIKQMVGWYMVNGWIVNGWMVYGKQLDGIW